MEKKALSKAATTLATASVKLAIFMAADYCLFWILDLIKYYGRFQSKVQAPNIPTAHISGNGFLADLLRSIVKAFQPVGIQLEIDTVPCLPTPIPPNYDRYVQIATLILLCWFLTLLEPYGLRLRHTIMCYYHPTRAKQRSIWLYNHIMRSRNSFLKFARRQLRRKILGSKDTAKVTCKEYLAANLLVCRLCLGEGAQAACLLCGEVFRESDDKKPIRCHTPDCPGIYCEQCFADLQNLCTVCLSPIDYGDLSDISEEKDSSEEEQKILTTKDDQSKLNRSWCCKICRKCFSKGREDFVSEDVKKKSWFKRKTDSSDDEGGNLLNKETEEKAQKDAYTDMANEDKKMKKDKDSDYYSSDNSTDYSYSYQYDKSQYNQPIPKLAPFKDVEKQGIPDYASMESFREESRAAAPRTILPQKGQKERNMLDRTTSTVPPNAVGTAISGDTFENIKKGRPINFVGEPTKSKLRVRRRQRINKGVEEDEEMPLMHSTSSSSDDGQLIHHQPPIMGLSKSTKITTGHLYSSSISSDDYEDGVSVSYSSIDSEIRDDLRYIQSMVPDVYLPQLTEPCTCKYYADSVFTNLTYDEISESPRSTASSKNLTSSTVISSLKDNVIDVLDKERFQDESIISASSTKEVVQFDPRVTPSSVDNYNFENNQRKKVKEYYKAVKDVPSARVEEKRKPGKIMRFLHKIFPKRKKNNDVLPLYSNEKKDVIELKPYNYPQGNWDTSSASIYSSTYIGPDNSTNTENLLLSEEEDKSRIRGGQGGASQNSYRTVEQQKVEETTNWARHFETGDAFSEDFVTYSATVKPTTLIIKDLLSKYFVSIDDLTPTRDCDISMNTIDARKPSFGNNPLLVRELPEKDATQPQVIKTSESDSYKSAKSQLSVADNVQSSSSSNLSEHLCMSILGAPCQPIKRRASKPSDNNSVVQRNTGHKVKQERLSSISETEVSETNPTTSEVRNNKSTSFKIETDQDSQESLLLQTEQNTEQNRTPSLGAGSCCCESISPRNKVLQTCPTSILKYHCASDEEIMDSPRYNMNNDTPIDGTDTMFGCSTDKYPVREKRVAIESQQENFFTIDKMQQTSDNEICRSSPRSYPTAIDSNALSNKAIASSNTASESGRARTAGPSNRNFTFIESTETVRRPLSIACACRYSERQPAGKKCGYNCCNCPPPPPPRYADYANLKGRNYRNISAPDVYPKYVDCSNKCLRDTTTDYSTVRSVRDSSTSTKKTCRDVPLESGYSLRESQYNEFKRDPTDSCPTECPRKYLPSDGDFSRRRKKAGSIIICTCNGDCRRCRNSRNHHSCQKYRPQEYDSSSSDISDGDSDEDNYLSDTHPTCFELPYQNNEEYLELVQELEETLQSRNRNRVRRAMKEFEHRSKYNKPLEKPIINYDETSESEQPIIQKISQLTSEKNRCCAGDNCSCRREMRVRYQSSAKANKIKSKERQRPKSGGYPCSPRHRHRSPNQADKTHWQMDPASGEWYKVSGSSQTCKSSRAAGTSHREYCPYECSCCSPKTYDYR